VKRGERLMLGAVVTYRRWRIEVRMTQDEKLELDALSAVRGKTRSTLIRQLVHKAASESVERHDLIRTAFPHTDK
jgi:uncharacterized protein (DUF1778 family)